MAEAAKKSRGECAGCRADVFNTEQALKFEESLYHLRCFVCCYCGEKMEGGVMQHDSKIYHPLCLRKCREAAHPQQQAATPAASTSSSQGVQTVSLCTGCNKSIEGKQIAFKGRQYHPDCMICIRCKNKIAGQFLIFEDDLVCEVCVPKLKAEYEEKHKQQVAERVPNAGGHTREETTTQSGGQKPSNLPTCCVCFSVIEGEYMELAGKSYCVSCAELMQKGMVCGTCRKQIQSGVKFRNASGKMWHLECFKCTTCKKVIEGRDYFEHGGKFYCEDDYVATFGKFKEKCPKCLKALTSGEVAIADGLAFHEACFVCTKCNSPFQDGKYNRSQSGAFYCQKCFRHILSGRS